MRIGYVLVFGFVLASSSAARADHHHHSSKKAPKPAATAPPPVDKTERVPIVFHPTSLLYPVGATTLELARDRDVAALDAVMKKSAAERVIFIAIQKKSDTTAPLTLADVAPIGVVAKISKVERKADKVATLTYEPLARARVTAITGGDKTAMLAAIERAPSTGKLSAERVNALGDWMDRYEKQFAGRVTLPVRSNYPDDAQFVDAIAKAVLVEHLDDTNRAALLAEPDVDLRAAELLKDVAAHTPPPPPPTKGKGKQKK